MVLTISLFCSESDEVVFCLTVPSFALDHPPPARFPHPRGSAPCHSTGLHALSCFLSYLHECRKYQQSEYRQQLLLSHCAEVSHPAWLVLRSASVNVRLLSGLRLLSSLR